jgi:hypothetical protein
MLPETIRQDRHRALSGNARPYIQEPCLIGPWSRCTKLLRRSPAILFDLFPDDTNGHLKKRIPRANLFTIEELFGVSDHVSQSHLTISSGQTSAYVKFFRLIG